MPGGAPFGLLRWERLERRLEMGNRGFKLLQLSGTDSGIEFRLGKVLAGRVFPAESFPRLESHLEVLGILRVGSNLGEIVSLLVGGRCLAFLVLSQASFPVHQSCSRPSHQSNRRVRGGGQIAAGQHAGSREQRQGECRYRKLTCLCQSVQPRLGIR